MNSDFVRRYREIAASFNSKFRFDYSPKRGRAALLLLPRRISKIDGMMLDVEDYIITCNMFGDGSFGVGFDVDGRLFEADARELGRVIHLARTGKYLGSQREERVAMGDARRDVFDLRNIERALYSAGFVLPEVKVPMMAI